MTEKKTLFPDYFKDELESKAEAAMQFLEQEQPLQGEQPYWVGFSGGKDSVVLKDIVERSGVRAEYNYSLTTIDPPELVKFNREVHPDVIWNRPKHPFFHEMSRRGLPMRPHGRWCCQEYKESGPTNTSKCRTVVLGIRNVESPKRQQRQPKEQCFKVKTKTMINPILEWRTDEIWAYIKSRNLKYCELYDQGFERLGCVGCPFASQKNRDREFARWPKFRAVYKIFINRLWEKNKDKPWAKVFNNGNDLAEAWITKINPFPPKVLTELFEQYVN